MRFVLRPRRAGKTRRSLEWLLESPENRVLVTHSHFEVQRLTKLANEMMKDRKFSGKPPRIRIFGPDPNALRGVSGARWIDNADLLLRTLFGDVQGVTAIAETTHTVCVVEVKDELLEWSYASPSKVKVFRATCHDCSATAEQRSSAGAVDGYPEYRRSMIDSTVRLLWRLHP